MIPLGVLASRRADAGGGGLYATLTDSLTGTGNQSGLTVEIGAPALDRTVIAAVAWGRTATVERRLTNPAINGDSPEWAGLHGSSASDATPAGFSIFGGVVSGGTTTTVGWFFGSSSTPGWRLMVYTVPSPLVLHDFESFARAIGDGSALSVTTSAAPGDLIIASRSFPGGIEFTSGIESDDFPADPAASTGQAIAAASTHTVIATPTATSPGTTAAVGVAVLRPA